MSHTSWCWHIRHLVGSPISRVTRSWCELSSLWEVKGELVGPQVQVTRTRLRTSQTQDKKDLGFSPARLSWFSSGLDGEVLSVTCGGRTMTGSACSALVRGSDPQEEHSGSRRREAMGLSPGAPFFPGPAEDSSPSPLASLVDFSPKPFRTSWVVRPLRWMGVASPGALLHRWA